MVYVLANLVVIGLAVYKCNAMGLLPTAQSDWLEFMAARKVLNDLHIHIYSVFPKWSKSKAYWKCIFLVEQFPPQSHIKIKPTVKG